MSDAVHVHFRVLVGTLTLVACAENVAPLRVDIPIAGEDRSLVVAVVRGAETPEVRAFEIIDGEITPPWIIDVRDEEPFTLQVLIYDDAIDQLGLSTGVVTPTIEGPSRALPTAARILARPFDGTTIHEWSTESEVEPSVAAFRIPLDCRAFTLSTVPLPDDVPATFLVADGDRVLMGTMDGRLYVAYPDGRLEALPDDDFFWDAYADPDGTLHMVGRDGRVVVARLTPDDPPRLTIIEERTVGTRDLFFAAGDPTRRFASSKSVLFATTSGAWEEALSITKPRGLSSIGEGLARGVFGYEFYVLGPDGEDGVHTSAIAGGMTAVGYVPNLGPLAGTEYGQLYRRREQGDWELLQDLDPALLQIRGFAPYRDGFVYARSDALLQVDGTNACPDIFPVGELGNRELPEIGVKVEDAVDTGGRAELTVVGNDIAALGWRGVDVRVPELLWFRPM